MYKNVKDPKKKKKSQASMVNSIFLPKRWTEIKAYYSFKIFVRLWLAQIWQNVRLIANCSDPGARREGLEGKSRRCKREI